MGDVCEHCGASLSGDAVYCSSCGEPVDRDEAGLVGSARRWLAPVHRSRRTAGLAAAAALLALALLVVVAVRLTSSSGSSSASVVSGGVGASEWPAGVATGFLADCGRTNPSNPNYCTCALSEVENHFSATAWIPVSAQIDASGKFPESVTRVEARCKRG